GIIFRGAAGTATNYGVITATKSGGVGARFVGNYDNTLINVGTIGGAADAVLFGGGNDRPVPGPGAAFMVKGGGGARDNTRELAAVGTAGTITGLGTSFVGFGSITVDGGAQWTITGGNSLASGVTLTDLGTLTNAGTITGAGAFIVDPTTFTNTGYMGLT